MKAAVCYEFGRPLVVEEVDLDPPRKDEVKVRIATTAVCHSDIHLIRGEMSESFGKLPLIAGHESSGYVAEVGNNVTSVKPGDAVVATVLSSCGECLYCTTGLPHQCKVKRTPEVESLIHNKQGQSVERMEKIAAFAEYVVVDKSQVVKVPRDMPIDRAALLACGVITGFGAVVFRARVKPLSSVVVIGCGGVGLNAVQGAAFVGAHPVIAVDIVDRKLEAARSFGATHTVNARQGDVVQSVKQLIPGDGADYVFLMGGSTDTMLQGFAMTGTRGMTVLVGVPPAAKSTLTVSAYDFIGSERMLTGAFMGSTRQSVEIPRLVALYQAGRLKLDELITGRYPLEQINEAIESVERGEALRNLIMF